MALKQRISIWLRRHGIGKPMQPHELAELGLGVWGHQAPASKAPGDMQVKGKAVGKITLRVFRASTQTWEDI